MNTKPTLFVVYMATLVLTAAPTHAEDGIIFEDSFESGDMGTTNDDGFSWGQLNRTSIVTQSEEDGNVVIFNAGDGSVYKIKNDDRNWTAFEGNNSLRFRYPADEEWAEQRFDLGTERPEIWMSYWLQVPINYQHIDSPSVDNGKWFALWMDDYDGKGEGSTIIGSLEMDTDSGEATGSSNLNIVWSRGGYTVVTPRTENVRIIDYPNDLGRWMQFVIRVKAATNAESNNGIIETWRRWEGETNFTKLHEVFDAELVTPTDGPYGWKKGYLLGYRNAPFDENTEFLLDNFTLSETCLVELQCLAPPPAPNPPNSIEMN